MKRCYPGGYREVVRRLRATFKLATLTPQAEAATAVLQRNACKGTVVEPVYTQEKLKALSESRLETKAGKSKQQTAEGVRLKTANADTQEKINVLEGGCPAVPGKQNGISGSGATDSCDRSGRTWRQRR